MQLWKLILRNDSAPPRVRQTPARGKEPDKEVKNYSITTGKHMVDQFQSWYFGVAFLFVFKYCTGMPEMPAHKEKQRYRRGKGAPRIETEAWVRCMARRVEAQISRNWNFGFASWNFLFRSSVNLSRTLYSYATAKDENGHHLTPEDLKEGAILIHKALADGKYEDVDGKRSGSRAI